MCGVRSTVAVEAVTADGQGEGAGSAGKAGSWDLGFRNDFGCQDPGIDWSSSGLSGAISAKSIFFGVKQVLWVVLFKSVIKK